MITHAIVTWEGLYKEFMIYTNTPSMSNTSLQFSKQPRAFGPINVHLGNFYICEKLTLDVQRQAGK